MEIKRMDKQDSVKTGERKQLPELGLDHQILLKRLLTLKKHDLQWEKGRSFSYIYFADPSINETLKKAYTTFFSENALNPTAFPSLRGMEKDVVQMCLSIFNASKQAVGSMTSGGTESILMAVKSAKEYSKSKGILLPEIVLPKSAHPAFNKACDYFDIKINTIPLSEDYRVNIDLLESAINSNTILIVASAPQYPQGVVDPISEIGKIAIKHHVLFHVDACVGGFVLPFLKEKIEFDLSVPGVTSLSADIHKYGYASKGASVILYNRPELRKAQFYVHTDWSGGMYASPSILGTRPGGAIAVAWTVLQLLGKSGYKEYVEQCMELTNMFQSFIESFPELELVGKSNICIFSIKSKSINIYELGDELYVRGWLLDRQQLPASLHLSLSPNHKHYFDEFKSDFLASMEVVRKGSFKQTSNKLQVTATKGLKKILPKAMFSKIQKTAIEKANPDDKRSAALYGMIGDLQGSGELEDLIRDYLDNMTR